VPQPTSTVSSAEATGKRALARTLADEAGFETLVATNPATVRWLLCGKGRPVSTSSPEADYAVVLTGAKDLVIFPDIEASRVELEERFEEIGYEAAPFPWHDGREQALANLLDGEPCLRDTELESVIAPFRRHLGPNEVERYGAAGADVAAAMVETVRTLDPEATELDVAAELAARVRRRDFFAPVVLVAGEDRQPVHRHPLPTGARLGRHALLAVTAEREGLHVSMTRLVSFGPPPRELADLVGKAATVDVAVLEASRPGRTLGEVFARLVDAYSAQGLPDEWRRHHQGGLTAYLGREAFATPGNPTLIPDSAAVAWNPSITGGAKSEDTALVSQEGVAVITRTPSLPEFEFGPLARPAIVEL
jgi:Xaa-Pro aminopeptidase